MTATTLDTDPDLVSHIRGLWDITKRYKQPRYRMWERNYQLLNNTLGGLASESWMPAPRTSEIYPILANLVAWLADQQVNVSASAAMNPGDEFADFIQRICSDLSTVLQSRWSTGQFERQEKLCLWDAFTYGSGILKSAWDDSLYGGLGDITLRRVDPWSFYPNPGATSEADMQHSFEVRLMSIDEIERRFPDSALLVDAKSFGSFSELPERPQYGIGSSGATSPSANPASISGTMPSSPFSGRPGFVNPSQNIAVFEFWSRENSTSLTETLAPDATVSEREVNDDWCVTVLARGEILMREKASDLWKGGWQPYSRYAYDDIGEFWGIALVDHMAQPQIYVNRLLTAMQMNYELTGQPKLLEAKGGGTDRSVWDNRPGGRMSVDTRAAQANLPRFLQPPAMPSEVMELLRFHIERMENVAGITAQLRGGGGTAGRTTQGVMSSIQEASFVRIRNGIANFEYTLEDAGQKLAELVCENYDQPRFLAVTGPSGEQSSIALQARHFNVPTDDGAAPLNPTVLIDAGSELPTSLQARNARADKLYTIGAIDREAYLKDINYPNRSEVLARIQKQIEAGTFAPPGQRARSRGAGSSPGATGSGS